MEIVRILARATVQAERALNGRFDMSTPETAAEVMKAMFQAVFMSPPPKKRRARQPRGATSLRPGSRAADRSDP